MAAEIVTFQPAQSLTPLYDAAVRALEQAKTSEECKGIADRTAALEYYARLVKDKIAEANLKELKMQAKRHLGVLLKEEKKSGKRAASPGRPKGGGKTRQGAGPSLKNNEKKTSEAPTISRQQAHEATKLADMPKAEFDAKVQAVKEATVNPPPRRPAPPVLTANQRQWEEWLDKIPSDFLMSYIPEYVTAEAICKAFRKVDIVLTVGGQDSGAQQDQIRKAEDERKQLQERIRQLEEEKRQLEERIKAPATRDVAAELGAMAPNEIGAVIFRLVTDYLPTDPRVRQEWGKSACRWINDIYGKLHGPQENPWKWRQKVHRLIKLPLGVDLGKPGSDEIGDNPTTASEADMARDLAPPRPAGELPKLAETVYPRFKPDKRQSGRRTNRAAFDD